MPTAQQLASVGIAALDIGGAGGTSWSEVEKHRAESPVSGEVAAAFRSWGIPTAESLVSVHCAVPDMPLIASGGLATGVDVALCVALGASLAGMARPLLGPAVNGLQALDRAVYVVLQQLRIAMFACGARTVEDLGAVRVRRRD